MSAINRLRVLETAKWPGKIRVFPTLSVTAIVLHRIFQTPYSLKSVMPLKVVRKKKKAISKNFLFSIILEILGVVFIFSDFHSCILYELE